ncbi:Protein of unknown function [Pyronema omphalodes CBS 100304]|uniref:Uncharacterized protein n=1 Tax=Pyronema omphalodes (strain CBS 100304) TaxID=1076935 RepID=U4KW60_PYROM|nr:Protein of unknown function [Pyronema omphalodes CBS 100304]
MPPKCRPGSAHILRWCSQPKSTQVTIRPQLSSNLCQRILFCQSWSRFSAGELRVPSGFSFGSYRPAIELSVFE